MKFLTSLMSLLVCAFLFSCSDNDKSTNSNADTNAVNSMVLIPAGTFQMGNPDSSACEQRTIHTVIISKSFYMSKYEVTQAQYSAIMDTNPSYNRGENLPAERMTWEDAVSFCNKLSVKEGLTPCYSGSGEKIVCDWTANGYRLPTSAEWEYACRAGSTTSFYNAPATEADIEKIAWFDSNSGGTTHHVGQKSPNAFGLYDMVGNVWEFCWDKNGYQSLQSQTDPKGSASGDGRIQRGGSFDALPYYCRAFYCDPTFQNFSVYSTGFRIARNSN